jgi:hypothetical protein
MENPGRYAENISHYRVFVNGNGNANIVSASGPDETIIDASDPAAQGGGIHCEDCNPTIKNCKIVGNEGDDGGIYVNACGLTIINSTIADNFWISR